MSSVDQEASISRYSLSLDPQSFDFVEEDKEEGVLQHNLIGYLDAETSLPSKERRYCNLFLSGESEKASLCMAHALGKSLKARSSVDYTHIVKSMPTLTALFSDPEQDGSYEVSFYRENASETGYEATPLYSARITKEEDKDLKELALRFTSSSPFSDEAEEEHETEIKLTKRDPTTTAVVRLRRQKVEQSFDYEKALFKFKDFCESLESKDSLSEEDDKLLDILFEEGKAEKLRERLKEHTKPKKSLKEAFSLSFDDVYKNSSKEFAGNELFKRVLLALQKESSGAQVIDKVLKTL